jgi:hypothetical protein
MAAFAKSGGGSNAGLRGQPYWRKQIHHWNWRGSMNVHSTITRSASSRCLMSGNDIGPDSGSPRRQARTPDFAERTL